MIFWARISLSLSFCMYEWICQTIFRFNAWKRSLLFDSFYFVVVVEQIVRRLRYRQLECMSKDVWVKYISVCAQRTCTQMWEKLFGKLFTPFHKWNGNRCEQMCSKIMWRRHHICITILCVIQMIFAWSFVCVCVCNIRSVTTSSNIRYS